MKYNRENYESSALDYLENNLSAEDRAEFEVFLLLNPDIQESFNEFELVEILPIASVTHPNKEALLKDDGKGRVIFFNRKIISLAAAVLLLLVAVFFYLPKTTQPTIARIDVKTIIQPETPVEKENIGPEELAVIPAPPVDKKEVIAVDVASIEKAKTTPTKQKIVEQAKETSNVVEAAISEEIEWLSEAPEIPLEELLKVDERVVYQVAKITENAIALIPPKEYRLEELDFPILVIDEEELLGKEPSKFKRFLARANLIPSDYTSDDHDSFKQNLLPESIPGLK